MTDIFDTVIREGERLEVNQDAEQLRLLSIFHYVLAGVIGFTLILPIGQFCFGMAIVSGAFGPERGPHPPEFMGWFIVYSSLFYFVVGLGLAICLAIAGRKLQRRTGYYFCLVIAGLECLFVPIGTVLGTFTILVLSRASVKTLFGVPVETVENG